MMGLLNTPIQVKDFVIKNRLVMPPMATAKASPAGKVTNELCEYYEEKSKGGYFGLIITEHSFISRQGKAHKGQVSISMDSDIKELEKIVSVIHNHNTKVFAQINHAGGATQKEITGFDILSASAVPLPAGRTNMVLPKEMTQSDIDKVIADFAEGAFRAKSAGYDGVEIHSAHGYLLNQFFSPLTNKRTDKYSGATLQGRMELHLEIIHAVRKRVGNSYPIALRLGACDYMEGGITIEDSIAACKEFEKAGIDLLDISGGFCSYISPKTKRQGYFSELSEPIKKAVHIPVILTGGITTKEAAEELLQTEKADMIGIGRAILRNSDLAKQIILSL